MDFGTRVGHDPQDLLNSKTIVIWGRNPLTTNYHLIPLLNEAKRRGALLVLVDPVRSETARLCDRHFRPKPAGDAHLAMAMAKVILEEGLADESFLSRYTHGFEAYTQLLDSYTMGDLCRICNLRQDEVRDLARLYGTHRPAAILPGWGLNKYKHSAEIFRCVDALAALCGNIGIPGGGVTHGYDTQRHFDKAVEAADRATRTRFIPEPLLGRGLLEAHEPPIKMMFVNAANPVNQCPNSRLVARTMAALDFVVVVDTMLTDSSDVAHLFLPATTFLEEEDMVVSWGHNIIGGVNPVIAPVGEARSDLWIFQQLAERLGFGHEMAGTPRHWLHRIFTPLERKGVTVDQVLTAPVRCPVAPLVAFESRRFSTPSGKFEFITHLDYQERRVEGFPMTLITDYSKKWLLSQLLEKDHPRVPWIRISPDTAAAYCLVNGERAIVRTPSGQLEAEVVVDKAVGADIVVMPVGTWIKRGGGVNVLTEDIMSNFGEMAAYGETRVILQPQVARARPG